TTMRARFVGRHGAFLRGDISRCPRSHGPITSRRRREETLAEGGPRVDDHPRPVQSPAVPEEKPYPASTPRQAAGCREEGLPSAVPAGVSVEQASTFGWSQYVGTTGHTIGMKTFGASAPLKELPKKFGFTADAVVAAAKEQVGKKR